MKQLSIRFDPAELMLTINTNSDLVIDYITNVYHRILTKKSENFAEKITIYEDSSGFEFEKSKDKILKTNNFAEILVQLNRSIKNNYKSNNYWPFHGGIILSKNNEGVILCGNSGSGKSTLCIYLKSVGFTCPTDDLIWVKKDNFTIIPMHTSINIRDDVKINKDFKDLKFIYCFPEINGSKRWVIQNDYILDKPINIKSVINVNYNKDKNSLKKLNTSDAIKLSLLNSYMVCDMKTNYKMSVQMVKRFKFYEMYHSSCEAALKLIENLLKILK